MKQRDPMKQRDSWLFGPALRDAAVSVDATIAEEGPPFARLFEEREIEIDDERLFSFARF